MNHDDETYRFMAYIESAVRTIADATGGDEDMLRTLGNLKLLCRAMASLGGFPAGTRVGIDIDADEVGEVTLTVKRPSVGREQPFLVDLGDREYDTPRNLRGLALALILAAVAMRERECPCN